MKLTHDVHVTLTLRWEPSQFEILRGLLSSLSRHREDPGKLRQVTDELKSSGQALSEAVTRNQPPPDTQPDTQPDDKRRT